MVSGAGGWTGEGCMVDVIDSTSISSAVGRISLTIELTTNSCTLYHGSVESVNWKTNDLG